jgi:type III secretion protein L
MSSRVVRAQFPEVRARALLDAEAQATRALAAAHAEAEAIRGAAEEEYDTWRAQAVREAEEQVAADAQAAQLAALARESRALADLREAAVPLVMRATEKLVRATFDARPELVRSVILDAARHLKLAQTLEVEVHPDDVSLAESLADGERPLSVRAAPDLARGECRVLSDVGAVDARFATQLDALAQALRGALAQAPRAET